MSPLIGLGVIVAVVVILFGAIYWLSLRIEPDEQGHERITSSYDD